jgi:hypothetical protein
MSIKPQVSVGKDYRLSLLDEAVVLYHTQNADFIQLQDHYLNCPHGEERYYYSSPDCIIMAEVLEDEVGRYWRIAYAASRDPSKSVSIFFQLAPFPLDRVLFTRYHRMHKPNSEKFFSWESLKRISEYGLKTKSTSSSSSSPSPCCSRTSAITSGTETN